MSLKSNNSFQVGDYIVSRVIDFENNLKESIIIIKGTMENSLIKNSGNLYFYSFKKDLNKIAEFDFSDEGMSAALSFVTTLNSKPREF